jgi:hypothetical protein
MARKKPTLKKGPASQYEAPNEVIREFGNGKGDGGLLSLRILDDGTLLVEVYATSGPVRVLSSTPVNEPAAALGERIERSLDIDTVVETRNGEKGADRLVEGDIWREFGDDEWLKVVERDQHGDTVLLTCTAESEPTEDNT